MVLALLLLCCQLPISDCVVEVRITAGGVCNAAAGTQGSQVTSRRAGTYSSFSERGTREAKMPSGLLCCALCECRNTKGLHMHPL